MGVLSGMAEGFGRGMAGYGQALGQQAIMDEREQQMRSLEMLRQTGREDLVGLKAELAAVKAGAGGSKDKGLSLDEQADFLSNPKYARLREVHGGMTPEQDAALQDLTANGRTRPADPREYPPEFDPATDKAPQVEKYTPGQATQLLERGRNALYSAVGLVNPAASDDLQKSQNERKERELNDNYVATGDRRSGEGVLLLQGKGVRSNDGTSEIDGTVPKGSIGESKRAENFAHATEYNAKADSERKSAAGDGAKKVQKIGTNAQGQAVIYFKDGTSKLAEVGGKPVTTQEYESRIDKVTESLLKNDLNFKFKSPDERRQAAIDAIAAPAAPSPAPKPEAAPAPSSMPPANLLKEGVNTKFKNGETWTLRGGKPVKVS